LEEAYEMDYRDPIVTNRLGNCYLLSSDENSILKAMEMFELSYEYGKSKFGVDKRNELLGDSLFNLFYINSILSPEYKGDHDLMEELYTLGTNMDNLLKVIAFNYMKGENFIHTMMDNYLNKTYDKDREIMDGNGDILDFTPLRIINEVNNQMGSLYLRDERMYIDEDGNECYSHGSIFDYVTSQSFIDELEINYYDLEVSDAFNYVKNEIYKQYRENCELRMLGM
jgi:hypothetical protein